MIFILLLQQKSQSREPGLVPATAATVLLEQKTAAMPLRTSLNSATCQDTRGNHTCQCWPGVLPRHP